MKHLDIENWVRRKHYELFKQMDYPHFSICANVDISRFYGYLKEKDISFFKAMVYAASKAANNIEEFKYRIRKEKVVVHDLVHPSFTVLSKSNVFSFCTVNYSASFSEFYREADFKMRELEKEINLEDEPGRDDLLYITSIPWVSFTSITHPVHMHPADSVPRISWGKFFEENGAKKLPLSVQVNHALMDGVHVGKYFSNLQEILDYPDFDIQF